MYHALIVEDEPLMREYLFSSLGSLNALWEATEKASDGMEALQKLQAAHFDAVITDIRMPRMDGLELSKQIQQLYPSLRVILLTGYNEFDYARTAIRLNVFDYLLKPLNDAELSAALDELALWLGRQSDAQQAATDDDSSRPTDDGTLLVRQAREYISQRFGGSISLSEVAEALGVTPAYLSTRFHHETGCSYTKYLLKLRMEAAAQMLDCEPDQKVYQIGEMVGFPSAKHFAHVFGSYFGMSPKEYRAKSKNKPTE